MPEGNVIHHHARRLARAFAGAPVRVDSPQGRFDAGARLVSGRVVRGVDAYGKHLFIDFEAEDSARPNTVHVHLGLFGKWRFGTGPSPEPRGEVRMRLMSSAAFAELRGPTTCEVLDEHMRSSAISKIGPDPIRRDADRERAWQRVSRSQASIAGLLMNQEVFAGVGNIYRAEVLFRAGIAPERPGREVDREEFDVVWNDLVTLMRAGVRRARIDTVRPEHMPKAMGRRAREDRHGGEVYVYRRTDQPCLVCGTPVARADLQGRNLYWCSTCQSS